MSSIEVNFDGLVGPTHNYAGLAFGNLASNRFSHSVSSPKQAALQGLNKMQRLIDLGLTQALIPPHERPNLAFLYEQGFRGSAAQMLDKAFKYNPALLAMIYSASSMWTANAATVSTSSDTHDQKIHFTPANLVSNPHRAQEAEFTTQLFRQIFADPRYFVVHPPLPNQPQFADEGAANHTRFCADYGKPGVELWVYGQHHADQHTARPQRYPARQTLESAQQIVQQHQLDPKRVIFAQQNPHVIDQGVFHNDVISVGNRNVFLYHQQSFVDTPAVIEQLKAAADFDLYCLEINTATVSVAAAVESYLFNSQLVTIGDHMQLLAPSEAQEHPQVFAAIQALISEANPIRQVEFLDLRQSMHNGGGPACLRLRVVMNEQQRQHCHQGILLDRDKIQQLKHWVETHYRDSLAPEDLRDPQLLDESYQALDALSKLLNLGSIYRFQQV